MHPSLSSVQTRKMHELASINCEAGNTHSSQNQAFESKWNGEHSRRELSHNQSSKKENPCCVSELLCLCSGFLGGRGMALSDLTCVGYAVLSLGLRLETLGFNRYKSSTAWSNFPDQLEQLAGKHKTLVSELDTHVLVNESCEPKVIDQVLHTRSLLECEVHKLKTQKTSFYSGCIPTLGKITFPESVLETIQATITLFSEIIATFRPSEEIRTVSRSPAVVQFAGSPIQWDSEFVHYDLIEAQVRHSLDDQTGPSVVLLHGDGGQGKTVVARHIAAVYGEKIRAHKTSVKRSRLAEKLLFNRVLFLECGPEAVPEVCLFRALRGLGIEGKVFPSDIQNSYGRGGDASVRAQLVGLLKDQSLLLILDDVCDTKIIQSFVEILGKGGRCLVTTQDESMWLDSTMIEMTVNIEDAKAILAAHVGLPGRVIPPHLEEVADRLIAQANEHPLSLTTLANAISTRRALDVEEWLDAERDLLQLLHFVDETAPNLNKKYPRTFWASMKVCVGCMRPQGQKLLLLAALCERTSIPEEVLRIMCESIDLLEGIPFDELRSELEERSLIIVRTQALPWADPASGMSHKMWSLHRLQKQFLRNEMSEEAEFFENLLLGDSNNLEWGDGEDLKLLKVLFALHFEKSLVRKAAAKWGVSFRNFSEGRRLAVEPFIWLIQERRGESASLARKVLLEYVCNDEVEDGDISHLLRFQSSAAATCWSLENMFWITEKSMIGDEEQSMITNLVRLLHDDVDRNSREKALRILINVAAKANATQRVALPALDILLPGLVHVLNRFQFEDEGSNLYKQQELALRVLNYLASEEENKYRIVNFPLALDVLVRCILKDDAVASLQLQEQATVTVAILAAASSSQTKKKIIEFPGVLGGLVRLLNRDERPHAQHCATAALAHLSVHIGEHNSRRMAKYPYTLSGLVNLLFKDHSPVSQMWAAWALTNLSVEEKNRKEIVDLPHALGRFVRLLSMDDRPEVQKWCASALSMLALDEHCRRKIAEFPDSLTRLSDSLYKERNPQVQTWAAFALLNLSGDPQTKAHMSKSLIFSLESRN